MGFDFLGFIKDIDFKKTDNIIGDILKGGLNSLQRPLGAVEGALSNEPDFQDIFKNPIKFGYDFGESFSSGLTEGFKHPEQQSVRNIGPINAGISRLPNRLQRPAEIATETALDPLTYVGVGLVGKGKFLGPVGEMLTAPVVGRDASFGRQIAGELATNFGGRAGSELGQKAAQGTPFETPASILGGVVGGGIGAVGASRALKTAAIKPAYQSMVEEQLHDGNIFDYLDSLKNSPNEGIYYKGHIVNSDDYLLAKRGDFATEQEWQDYLKSNKARIKLEVGNYQLKNPDYENAIAQLYQPEKSTNIELTDLSNQKFIRPNMNIIPLNHAIKDEALDASHDPFTSRFHEFVNKDPQLDAALGNWIGTIGGQPGQHLRNLFVNGDNSAKTLRDAGNSWRDWAYQQPESDFIKDINGQRYVLLYRGEKNTYYKLPDGRQYSYIDERPENINIYDPKTGTNEIYDYAGGGDYANVKTGDVISGDFIDKGEQVNQPIFDKSQPVYSMTSDPDVSAKSYFNSPIKVFDENGNQDYAKFILAQWVPVEDVIGPVGRNSREHEFLVMDRTLIPDDSFKKIVGVDKNAPPQTKYIANVVSDYQPNVIQKSDDPNAINAYIYKDGDTHYLQVGEGENKLKLTQISEATYNLYKKEGLPKDPFSDKPINLTEINPNYPKTITTHELPDEASAIKLAGEQPKLIAKSKVPQYANSEYFYVENGAHYIQVEDNPPIKFPTEDSWQAQKEKDSASGVANIYEGKPNPNTYYKVTSGGYGPNPAVDIKVPRNTITTGSGYEVNYNLNDYNVGQQLVDDTGFKTTITKDNITGNYTAITSKDGDTVSSPDLEQVSTALKNDGFQPFKSISDKLLGVFNGNKLGFAEQNVSPKSTIKMSEVEQPANVLASNITNPEIPTPKAANTTNLQSLSTKDVIEGFLKTGGVDKDIATQLSSLSKADRAQLADDLVNQLSLHGPQEDVVRTVINGFTKLGKGDSGRLAQANNILRGVWATGDGSWFGIQGLLSIPHMLVTGRLRDASDVITTSMLTLAGSKKSFQRYIERTLENLPNDAPALNDAVNAGLHLSILKGSQDINFNIVERLTRDRLQPDAAFAAAGDVARISEFYNTWRRYRNSDTTLEQIAKAVNRGTGIADKPFGGYFGSFALFAPRFFQSQLEIVSKSFVDGTVEGNLARRQLLSLLGTGVALTFAANELRGYGTELDPRDPNFLRIRNIEGQDISVFGPWDSLAKLAVHLGQGDFSYARTKLSPIASVATNLMMGENFRGEPFPPTGNPLQVTAKLAKSFLLPFAWQDVGQGGVTGQALNFFGVKSSPQSNSEKIDANMQNLGLDPNDPLDRRQFLADHPEMKSLVKETARKANDVHQDIAHRQMLNENAVTSDEESLTDFRDKRKILSRELRNKLDIINQGQEFSADTQQKRWIESYYNLFDQAADPITHDIVGQTFDKLESQWIASNGQGAYDYIQRYLGINKNPVEAQYLADMKKLDELGYFDTQKYDPTIYDSGLNDDQIEDYRNRVSTARNINPELASIPFEDAAFEVLSNTLTPDQIYAITLAGSEDFQNPEMQNLKDLYPELFLWFNPKATWSDYQGLKQLTPDQKAELAFAKS